MEFPFGHHRREQEEEEYRNNRPPPPPYINEQEQQYHRGHEGPPPPYERFEERPPPPYERFEDRPPPPYERFEERAPPPYERFEERAPPPYERFGHETPPPPPSGQESGYGGYTQSPAGYPAVVQHVSHEHQSFEPNPSDEFRSGNHRRPPSHDYDGSSEGSAGMPNMNNKRTVRIYSKADPDYSLTIRNGEVVLARSNENDEFQHWIKDEQFSTRVKDEKGMPSFSLVNKATGQAIKHSIAASLFFTVYFG